ncbi:hypothetical protein AKJ52_00860 [candidate division MSBL1 archaeon SCGC-AAA382C18]|uniref:DUF4268 domain-containing protein n=1 Tax=candidate division MSBL1 archaeon SCGC-AAA382C18 TaxID=1698281 RepID=A0A133VL05_9EURY|nr:hypothetical protein AKJ52_00860 [candidate division MSBL1 archaeon SCGC-AAA382C18]
MMSDEEAKKSSLKEEFSNEYTGFQPWLKNHIDRLNDELNTNLSVLDRERDTPSGFSADFWVEDEDLGSGVIECQLGKSDHGHLGKLVTYLTAFDGDFAIWVVGETLYEYEKTIDWLNEATEKSFFLVTAKLVEMGDLQDPVLFVKRSPGPVKEISDQKEKKSERDIKQLEFWDKLLEKCEEKGFTKFDAISSKSQGWIGKRSPAKGVEYQFIIRNNFARIRLVIRTGSPEKNEEIFDSLKSKREEIEGEFGDELEWKRKEDRNLCKIRKRVSENGLIDEDKWEETQEKMINSMKKFCETFDKHLRKL